MSEDSIIINDVIYKKYDSMYYVSAYGDVYSKYCKRNLKQHIDIHGYPRVDIHGKHMKIHKLVYLVWVGEIKDNMQINHIDDNKNNMHYTNLYLGTQKENINDCIRNNHRVGNTQYLKVYDKEKKEILTFCPSGDFLKYANHPQRNGNVKRVLKRNWFKERYEFIEMGKGVTTIESY